MKNNAKVYVKTLEKDKKTFTNVFVEVDLDNGEKFEFQCSPKFLNRKAFYKLTHNVPNGK